MIERMFGAWEEITPGAAASELGSEWVGRNGTWHVFGRDLSSIEVTGLSGYDRVVVLRAQQKMASFHEARLAETMSAIEDHCARLFDGDLEGSSATPTGPSP